MAHRVDDGGEVVVEQHDVSGFPRHIGAAAAHGDAHIGGAQGRCVVDPVAGDAHHLPKAAVALHQAQLLLGCHPGKHQPAAKPEQLAQLHVAQAGQVIAMNDPYRIGHRVAWRRLTGIEQSDLACDRLGGEARIAGHHGDLDARLAAGGDGGGHLGTRWVHQGQQPDKLQRALQLPVVEALPAVAVPPHRHSQHPQAPAGQPIGLTLQAVACLGVEADGVLPGGDVAATAQQIVGCPLGDHQGAIAALHHHAHAAPLRIKGHLVQARLLALHLGR